MAPAAPQLPPRHPCWCRAVYSWGGETERDLGFVEGDLIEYLNAGDGQWWMGRLRRDKRMAGLFPSNFVEVLGEDFVPVNRATSPVVQAAQSPIGNPTSAPKKHKTVFRKPFQAHKEAVAPSGELARNPSANTSNTSIPQTPPRNGSLPRSVKPLRTPASAVRQQSSLSRPSSRSRPPSSRAASPRPLQDVDLPPSSGPSRQSTARSRPPSRPVSPRVPYESEMTPPVDPIRQGFSRPGPPPHSGSPYMSPESEMLPDIPPRQSNLQSRHVPRAMSSNAPYEPDMGAIVPIRHNAPQSMHPPRPVSSHSPDVGPVVPIRHNASQSMHQARPVSPHVPEIGPVVPYRQNVSQYTYPTRPVSPNVPGVGPVVPFGQNAGRPVSPSVSYESEMPPPVPIRQSNSQSRPSPRPLSPGVSYDSDIPPPVPVRQSISQSRPSPRPLSPSVSYESDIPPPVPARRQSFVQPTPSPHPVSPSMPYESDLPPPVPVRHHMSLPRASSREISPLELQEREESPPPPPPPPHRVAVRRQASQESRSRTPAPLDMNDRYVSMSRTPSPAARSDTHGNTPSPLRDAMEDVMTSLEDMGMPRENQSPSLSPVFNNPWSPDAYDNYREEKPLRTPGRPLTSLGFERDGDKDHDRQRNEGLVHRNSVYTHDNYMDGPPQLNNYVQRMESRLRQMQQQNRKDSEDEGYPDDEVSPLPPPKHTPFHGRHNSIPIQRPHLKGRRSGHDLREDILNRSYTNKSSTTNSSSGVQSNGTNTTTSTGRTSQSLMSGHSAGGFSATSAGSFTRRGKGTTSERPTTSMDTFRPRGHSEVSRTPRPETPLTGISYHSSHNSSRQGASSAIPWASSGGDNATSEESSGVFGGLSTPKAKKQGFFKRIFDSAKTGAANARSSIAVGQNGGSFSPTKGRPVSPIRSPTRSPTRSPHATKDTSREMGGGSSIDWVQVRRDVHRAVSPSRNERIERAERCQMMDRPVIYAVEEFYETVEGDESIDGLPISEPTNFGSANLNLVDKSARFVNSLPPMTNAISLAQGYVCRPYKSDVQRLRALFTWVSEKIAFDEPVEGMGIDLKRVVQTKRGSPQEVAYLVTEMCAAVGLHAEAIKGYLKAPGELIELDSLSRPNHWWNAVLVDGEWRIMDCSLSNPTNPRRSQFVTNASSTAETWYFLARPIEVCYTHVPLYPEEQHICPPISPDVLLALPTACPPYFKHGLQFPDYDTSMIYIEGLEVMQIRVLVPPDVECAAEVEAPAFACDADGDYFESGEVVRKRALVQPDWINGQKRFTVKAVLPGDEGQGTVKIYAGKKGLMHSNREIPHPLAFALPISHTGDNPPYDFVLRHPVPHAQRHDLYIMQPQCARLAVNNTFVFAVRQHPSSLPSPTQGNELSASGRVSPSLFSRPASALSMVSSSAGGSSVSTVSNEFSASTSAISSRSGSGREKPAKLAIQSPSGKILRLSRKADHMLSGSSTADSPTDAPAEGSVWETVIKIGERGVWRGVVLADRVARWCVFCEWECF